MKLVDELGERNHIVFQRDEMSDLGFLKNNYLKIYYLNV
jgi:hypothetical protein